jgi:DNA-binding CsgD family transcriptional regulator
LERLKPRHRQLLRLVHQGLITKEIARRWKLSDDRVNKLIREARNILDGLSRQKAAHLVALYEASIAVPPELSSAPSDPLEADQPMGAHPVGLPRESEILPNPPANSGADVRIDADALAEQQDDYPASSVAVQLRQLMPVRIGRGTRNDLNITFSLTIVAVLTTAALLSAGAAASLLATLDALLRR